MEGCLYRGESKRRVSLVDVQGRLKHSLMTPHMGLDKEGEAILGYVPAQNKRPAAKPEIFHAPN